MLLSPYTLKPVVSQEKHAMSLDKMKRFMEFESLLTTLGWQIICAKCSKIYGLGKDGVQANNDAAGNTLTVSCGCSSHMFRNDQ